MIEFVFKPVEVKGGRKFKGIAYDLGNVKVYEVGPGIECKSAELWDPAEKKHVYANPKFIADRVADEAEILRDKRAYIDAVFNDTLRWCHKKSAVKTDAEVTRFARNCMLKRYPEWREEIDRRLPDQRQAIDEIDKTLDWALSRKSRPMMMCGGGFSKERELPERKKMLIAISSLKRRNIVDLPSFEDAWSIALTLRGLQDYISWIRD